MSSLATNVITDASGGNTTTINGYTPTVSNMAGRNLIINGDMRIAQRGTSATFSNGTNNYLVSDRWLFSEGGTEPFVFAVSQSTDAPSGFSNSLKLDCTTTAASPASSSSASFEQKIEAQDLQQLSFGTSGAKSLTLSFWVKSSKTGTYIVWFYQDDATRSVSAAYTISSANTWEHKTIVIDGDASGQIDLDNGSGFRVRFVLLAGTTFTSGTLQTSWGSSNNLADRYVGQVNLADSTDNDWYLTGVQLEVGSVATPFEHRPYGQELALCQRYYEVGSIYSSINGAGVYREFFKYSVVKRALATITTSTTPSVTNGGLTDYTYGFDIYQNGLTANGAVVGTVIANAEL
jgi:hypothetical protein